MVKKILFLLVLVITADNIVFAQTANKLIGKSYAYCKFSLPGTIIAPGAGKRPQTVIQERIIYLEIKDTVKPVIKTIYSGKYHFSNSITAISNFPESPGISLTASKAAIIKKRAGYSLWRIDIFPEDDQITVPSVVLNNYVVKGSLNGKPFTVSVKKETQLSGDMRY